MRISREEKAAVNDVLGKGRISEWKMAKGFVREFAREKIDYLYMDANHGCDAVKQDFEMYSPLVRENINGWKY